MESTIKAVISQQNGAKRNEVEKSPENLQ